MQLAETGHRRRQARRAEGREAAPEALKVKGDGVRLIEQLIDAVASEQGVEIPGNSGGGEVAVLRPVGVRVGAHGVVEGIARPAHSSSVMALLDDVNATKRPGTLTATVRPFCWSSSKMTA